MSAPIPNPMRMCAPMRPASAPIFCKAPACPRKPSTIKSFEVVDVLRRYALNDAGSTARQLSRMSSHLLQEPRQVACFTVQECHTCR